ncbi:MAG: type II toxin-antitoxin system Phd/YefM family antitoxin [Hylemonella sp.]|uniref:type II toxin-antitoxin system Phd/YefM family antitoxin n=1 Tax=Hylemonella sp. TaxID=2066020 RepID=UPI0022C58B57|nr:type II toxin-antitoxin system Phd/YefM family antitoxin [Hylemonella sp.]MCZ8253606.1 type II toxin-antitoxin system Phd/YefM family antitoxin [Hylemonella sp.]
MQTLLTELAISMSEFKKNPAAVLRRAQGRPVAVLNHNKVDFYLLPPALLERLLASPAADTAPSAPAGQAGEPQGWQGPHLLRQAKAAPD